MAEHDIVSIGMCSKIVLLRIFHDHTIYTIQVSWTKLIFASQQRGRRIRK